MSDPAPVAVDVRSVGFTPVKGMRHLDRPAATFDARGPVGDREYCLVDVAARQVIRTVQHPRLVAVVAHVVDGALRTTLPDGRSVEAMPLPSGDRLRCNYWGRPVDLDLLDGPHAQLVSSWLHRDVRLARAPRGAVVYGDPVTIVATASLQRLGLRAGLPHLVREASRFRATLLIETDEPYVEDLWEGQEIFALGQVLRIGAPVPRCAVVDIDPFHGRRGTHLLKALAADRPSNEAGEPHFGRYAHVTRSASSAAAI